jgi:hypothetical protein
LISGLPAGGARLDGFRDAARSWAVNDLNGALAWMKSLPEGRERAYAAAGLAQSWANSNPAEAAQFSPMLSGTAANDFNRALADAWAASDPQAAVQWWQSIPEQNGRHDVLASILREWSGQAPEAAARFVATLSSPEEQQSAALNVASAWAESDPGAAATWAASFATPELRAQAISSVVSTWAVADPNTSLAWIRGLAAGQDRAGAFAGWINQVAEAEPQLAATHFGEAPVNARETGFRRIAESWWRVDENSARQWINTAPVSSELRSEVLQQLGLQ